MRFVLAIAAFVVAAAMIVLGIAQRTVFLPPSTVAAEGTVEGGLPYTLVSGAVLNSRDGSQTVTVTGSDAVFVAYGRTSDVMAWLGDSEYAELSVDEETGNLTTTLRGGEQAEDTGATPTPTPTGSADPAGPETAEGEDAEADEEARADETPIETIRDPRGSDLWLSEYSEEQAVIAPISVPEDVSVLIASNGEEAAPDTVRLSWPVSNATPWAGPLIAGGILLLVVGLVLYLLGLNHLRKSRGPRRKGITAGPGLEQTAKPPRRRRRVRSRARSTMRATVPMLLVSGLLLSGCSASYWPDLSASEETPEPTDSVAVLPETTDEVAAPAVTVPQLERIISRISAVATEADADRNSELAATRFSGAALQERQSNYTIRGKVSDYGAPRAIPSSPLLLSLPQATDVWPRTVFTVVGDQEDTETPLIALMLRQETPRSNYTVDYAVSLEPNATIPESAPASVGAAFIPPDSPLMLVAPNNLATSYSDLIAAGAESEYAPLFAESDPFREIIASDRAAKDEGLEETATIEFSTAPGETDPLGLATISSGAIVAVSIEETETAKPVESGAVVKPTGAIAALVGLEETAKGTTATYADQLLFYVPPADSTDTVVLLGFSQALISAKELS
ncbi:glycosyl transferase [Labedella populi]|uniref:Glycosyl transferase n=1 Tax=Labedella populi TaxID=2498850 RepID=A0A3S4A620_9MICO|nr:glycosyl transferase [Labedella populi]RWZ61164.1 glycosyl transferase [Labedella populi]